MASKIDSIMRQGMDIYGAIKPIAQDAAQAYGGSRAKKALSDIDRGVGRVAQIHKGAQQQASQASALVERLSGAIGGY